ncbi:acyltransferase family protein [Desulfotomaculum copahuensis]|uniref:Acyltransferase 3 domain-containing protein n=1 Tax=Desulfotomaculum copahuensis TaxID=1838280 RepID=A0A1B7LGX1_9FIRM|nr:acyltransferase family protein [Desulfotomaculum copahuensis]OAT85320.1 hypothetical protein A6M21_17305 [Desulfotomaculum copahuensis]
MSNISPNRSSERLFFVDNLRIVLSVLVVLYHLAVIYAANTAFYYLEPSKDLAAKTILVIFQLLNQAYFMGFFFLLSGHFTPRSFDRKGKITFLKDRLLRLGVPLLLFYFLLSPLSWFLAQNTPSSQYKLTTPFTMGPLWFVAMLLIFDLCYVLFRLFIKNKTAYPAKECKPPKLRFIVVFILGLAIISYLLRIIIPFGMPILGFPSLAYLPQYLSFFMVGIIASRRNWFKTIPSKLGIVGFILAIVSTIILFPLALSGKSAFLGGGHWQSGVYALWDSIFSVGISLCLLTFFRHFFNHQRGFAQFLSKHSFTVYVIHVPIIVFIAISLRGIHPEQLLKYGLAALIGIPVCFAVAYLICKIPFADRVL